MADLESKFFDYPRRSVMKEIGVPILLCTAVGLGIGELSYYGLNELTNGALENYQIWTRVTPDIILAITGAGWGAAAGFLGYNSH